MKEILLVALGLSGWSFGEPLTIQETKKFLQEAIAKTGEVPAIPEDFRKQEEFFIDETCRHYNEIGEKPEFRAKLLEKIAEAHAAKDPIMNQPTRVFLLTHKVNAAMIQAALERSQSPAGKRASQKARLKARKEKKTEEWQMQQGQMEAHRRRTGG